MVEIGSLPAMLVAFLATVLLGFLIGLELHSYRREAGPDLGFGTTRTITLLAVLGFSTWLLDASHVVYVAGLLMTMLLFTIYYRERAHAGNLSLLPILVALLAYLLGPIAQTQPIWFLVLYVVIMIVMLGEQPGIRRLSDAFPGDEAGTLAKFLILLGVVLPLLPARKVGAPFGNLTYHGAWLAVVAVSGISYCSYLLQRFFLPKRGLLMTAALGGAYSSTAVTIVLARRAREQLGISTQACAAIVLATAVMYLRLLVIVAALGGLDVAMRVAIPFVPAALASAAVAFWIDRRGHSPNAAASLNTPRNPLELPTAFLFALLLLGFVALSEFALERFGATGLDALALLAGFGDVDAFMIALLGGKFALTLSALTKAIVLATGSNNLLKAILVVSLGRRRALLSGIIWLGTLFALSAAYALWE